MSHSGHQGGIERERKSRGIEPHGRHRIERLGGRGIVPQGGYRALLLARGADHRGMYLYATRTEGQELCHRDACGRTGRDADRRAIEGRTERATHRRTGGRRTEDKVVCRIVGSQPDRLPCYRYGRTIGHGDRLLREQIRQHRRDSRDIRHTGTDAAIRGLRRAGQEDTRVQEAYLPHTAKFAHGWSGGGRILEQRPREL